MHLYNMRLSLTDRVYYIYTYVPYAYKYSQEVCIANGDKYVHRYNSQKLETEKTSRGGCHERPSPCWPHSVYQFFEFLLSQFKPTKVTVMSLKKLHTYGTYGVIRSTYYANNVYIPSGSLRCIYSTCSANSFQHTVLIMYIHTHSVHNNNNT